MCHHYRLMSKIQQKCQSKLLKEWSFWSCRKNRQVCPCQTVKMIKKYFMSPKRPKESRRKEWLRKDLRRKKGVLKIYRLCPVLHPSLRLRVAIQFSPWACLDLASQRLGGDCQEITPSQSGDLFLSVSVSIYLYI